eukprot:Trichotokara_eunicae@DN6280_c0_g2_i1.p1
MKLRHVFEGSQPALGHVAMRMSTGGKIDYPALWYYEDANHMFKLVRHGYRMAFSEIKPGLYMRGGKKYHLKSHHNSLWMKRLKKGMSPQYCEWTTNTEHFEGKWSTERFRENLSKEKGVEMDDHIQYCENAGGYMYNFVHDLVFDDRLKYVCRYTTLC